MTKSEEFVIVEDAMKTVNLLISAAIQYSVWKGCRNPIVRVASTIALHNGRCRMDRSISEAVDRLIGKYESEHHEVKETDSEVHENQFQMGFH